MSDGNDHDHDHARTVKPMVDEITEFEVLEIALRELCIEKGIFTAEEHRRFTEFAEQIGPTPAARLVARAWLDPEFKELAVKRVKSGQGVGMVARELGLNRPGSSRRRNIRCRRALRAFL